MPGSWYRWKGNALILHIRVQPGSNTDEIAGPHGDQLKIRLRAPPVDGKANNALIRFVADQCRVARRDVEIVAGASGRDKRVRINAPESLPTGVQRGARPRL